MELSSLPMIELHLHLDGAIPPETMWDLANAQGLPLPAATLDDFRRWLARTSDCADVNTYLARFELPLQLMQDAPSIARVTKDLMTELSRQGHIYDEIRFAPQLHRREGLTQRQAIEAVLEGRRQALAENPGYDAGMLLCACSVEIDFLRCFVIDVVDRNGIRVSIISVDGKHTAAAGPTAFRSSNWWGCLGRRSFSYGTGSK